MQYLCLCYYDTEALADMSQAEQEAIGEACAPHDKALKATGKLLVQGSLSSPASWVHFVPEAGSPKKAQGPYLEGGHQAGAFFIIEAESMDEAEDVASKHAAANYGEHIGFAVELRACDVFESCQ